MCKNCQKVHSKSNETMSHLKSVNTPSFHLSRFFQPISSVMFPSTHIRHPFFILFFSLPLFFRKVLCQKQSIPGILIMVFHFILTLRIPITSQSYMLIYAKDWQEICEIYLPAKKLDNFFWLAIIGIKCRRERDLYK